VSPHRSRSKSYWYNDMQILIQNEQISLAVDTLGAQMMSLQSNGCEYLWQGDPQYWQDRAPILFPMIARLYQEKYLVDGREYAMGIHGFAAQREFSVAEHSRDRLVLRLESDAATLEQYPFRFRLDIQYLLKDSTVEVTFRVENTDCRTIHFGIGGHPGFRVPGEQFDEYRLQFAKPCRPDRVLFSDQLLLNGLTAPYPLKEGRTIPLTHSLFDEDAVILQNTDRTVSLCHGDKPCVTVFFPDMPYIGFWHWPKTDAPYVCIEPWSSLPGRQDVVEDLSTRSDLIHLPAGESYVNRWSVTIE